jgi:hypothetical protein
MIDLEKAVESALAAVDQASGVDEGNINSPAEAASLREILERRPTPSTLPRVEPVKSRPPTLVEQMTKLESIERELQARLRKEGVEAQIQAEMRITEANVRFTRQLSDVTADLTRKRDDEIHAATEAYHAKVDELSSLLRRRPA